MQRADNKRVHYCFEYSYIGNNKEPICSLLTQIHLPNHSSFSGVCHTHANAHTCNPLHTHTHIHICKNKNGFHYTNMFEETSSQLAKEQRHQHRNIDFVCVKSMQTKRKKSCCCQQPHQPFLFPSPQESRDSSG